MEFDRVPRITKYMAVIMLFAWFGRSTVWNFLPVFFENNINSVFLVGILTSVPSLVTILMDIPVGNLVQRAGEKVVIYMGFISALFPPLLFYTGLVPLFFLGKFMEGVGKAFIWNGGWSLILKSSDSDVESENISVFLLGVNLSVIIGPIIGGFLLAAYGFNLLFMMWTGTWLLSIGMYYVYIGTERGDESLREAFGDLERRKTYLDDWHHLKDHWLDLRKVLSLTFLYSIIFSFYWVAIPLILDQMNADYATMGLVFGIAALPKAFQFVFGDLADKVGEEKVIAGMSLLLMPTLFSMSLTDSQLVTGGLFFLAQLFTSGIIPAVHSKFDSAIPDNIEGEMTGFNELAKHSGQAIGPVLAGTLASVWSINASFVAAAGVTGLILVTTLVDF